MHGLVLAVLAIIFNYDGQNLAAVRMQARLDCLYLAGNGSMDRSADKAAGFRDRLSQVHGIANRNDRLCRCADVLREHNLERAGGEGHILVGCGTVIFLQPEPCNQPCHRHCAEFALRRYAVEIRLGKCYLVFSEGALCDADECARVKSLGT